MDEEGENENTPLLDEAAPEQVAAAPQEEVSQEIPTEAPVDVAPEVQPQSNVINEEPKSGEMNAEEVETEEPRPENTEDAASDSESECENKPKGRIRYLLNQVFTVFLSCCMPSVAPASNLSSRRPSYHFPDKKPSGKLGPYKKINDEIKQAFEIAEEAIKEKIATLKGSAPNSLEAIGFKEQHVVGTNLFIKIKIDGGPEHIHAKLYQPIEGEPCLMGTSDIKKDSDDIEYF